MKNKFRIEYVFNSNWSKVTRILIQKLLWVGSRELPSDWETVKSIPYLGEVSEEEAKKLLTELSN